MSQKVVEIPGLGEVLLVKRRGTKNLRLSIQPDGRIRVGLPAWAPYSAAIKFVAGRTDWIEKHRRESQAPVLQSGQRIGKSYRLRFVSAPVSSRTYARLGVNVITVSSPLRFSDMAVQKSASKACERALKKDAEKLLGDRLRQITARHGLACKSYRVKRLSSRWGSCSHDGALTFNYFLIQLPWHLIDYVIIHELVHVRQLNHSRDFWKLVEAILPNTKQLRKEIKSYQPILMPN